MYTKKKVSPKVQAHPKSLINAPTATDCSTLEDLWMALAKNVEQSLELGGAVPGKDYTILDCYKLAQPFALAMFKTVGADGEKRRITFDAGWPKPENVE